jgi:hypothetical protein
MIYRVDLFGPKDRNFPGDWGFCFELNTEVAIKLRDEKINYSIVDNFQETGRSIIKGFGLEEFGIINNPYHFIEDSALIQGVNVPGNACDLSLDDYAMDNFMESFESYKSFILENKKTRLEDIRKVAVSYVPHNVDTPLQASGLLSLLLNWANWAEIYAQRF